MNAVDRSEMAQWLDGVEARIRIAATDVATAAAMNAVDHHADSCWVQHIKPLNDKIDTVSEDVKKLLEARNKQAGAECRSEKSSARTRQWAMTAGGWIMAAAAIFASFFH